MVQKGLIRSLLAPIFRYSNLLSPVYDRQTYLRPAVISVFDCGISLYFAASPTT